MKLFGSHGHMRGPRPLDRGVVLDLRSEGIRTVASLERGYFEAFHDEVNQLAEWTLSSEMIYSPVQLGDITAPTRAETFAVISILSNPVLFGRVYLCCLHGQDRTGFMTAAYLVKCEGWEIERAIQDMYDNGFHKFPYEMLGWVDALRKYCE